MVTEQFAWRHYYWYLTNEGIQYLRDFLHLPPEIVPATLKRATRPEPRPREGGPSDKGPRTPRGPRALVARDRSTDVAATRPATPALALLKASSSAADSDVANPRRPNNSLVICPNYLSERFVFPTLSVSCCEIHHRTPRRRLGFIFAAQICFPYLVII